MLFPCVTTPTQFFSSDSSSNHLDIPRTHVCVLIKRRYSHGSRHNGPLLPLTINVQHHAHLPTLILVGCQTNSNLSATCAASALMRRLFRVLQVLFSSRCHSSIKRKTKQSSLSDSGVSGNVQTCRCHFGLEELLGHPLFFLRLSLYSFHIGDR